MASYEIRSLLPALLSFTLLAGAQILFTRVDIIMLGWLSGPQDAGLFRVAAQGGSVTSLGLAAIAQYIRPIAARLYHKNELEELARLGRKITVIVVAGSSVFGLLVIGLGKPAISILFGSEYLGAYPALIVLTIGQWVAAANFTSVIILNMAKFEKVTSVTILCAAVVSIALNFALIPPFGLIGAAASTSVCLVIANLVLWWTVRTRVFGTAPSKDQRGPNAL